MVARVPVKDEVGGSSPPAGAERSIVRICTMFMLLKVWFITPGMWVVPIKLKKEFRIRRICLWHDRCRSRGFYFIKTCLPQAETAPIEAVARPRRS